MHTWSVRFLDEPELRHLHEEDEAAGIRMEELLAIDDLIEAAHGRSLL